MVVTVKGQGEAFLGPPPEFGYTLSRMLFPDQSPVVLIALIVALLALGLMAAGRDLLRQPRDTTLACPSCGLTFDPQRWPQHNERSLYHGRYTVTPMYTCPRCGETVQLAAA